MTSAWRPRVPLAAALRKNQRTMVVASINWTVVLAGAVTGLTAILVGLIGVYSTKLTANVTKTQIEAETERLREAHKEAHLQHRQGVYHDLLNTERRGIRVIVDTAARREDRWESLRALYEHVNGAVLFGTEEVARQAVHLARILNEVRGLIDKGEEIPQETREAWLHTRRRLVDSMRRDIAPDSEAISVWPEPSGGDQPNAPVSGWD